LHSCTAPAVDFLRVCGGLGPTYEHELMWSFVLYSCTCSSSRGVAVQLDPFEKQTL
jgi:hypothetical protein